MSAVPLTQAERNAIREGNPRRGLHREEVDRYEATLQEVEKRERALLNYIGAEWCERCGGSGNGPTQYDGGACEGCGGEGLIHRFIEDGKP